MPFSPDAPTDPDGIVDAGVTSVLDGELPGCPLKALNTRYPHPAISTMTALHKSMMAFFLLFIIFYPHMKYMYLVMHSVRYKTRYGPTYPTRPYIHT
ncbi:MAG: hypothetical protein NVS2B12_20000 [Ktedonobacteraceae bacterium]